MCHAAKKTNTLRHLPFVSEFYQFYSCSKFKGSRNFIEPGSQMVFTHAFFEAQQKVFWVLSLFLTRSPAVILNLYKSMVRIAFWKTVHICGALPKSQIFNRQKLCREHLLPDLMVARTFTIGKDYRNFILCHFSNGILMSLLEDDEPFSSSLK